MLRIGPTKWQCSRDIPDGVFLVVKAPNFRSTPNPLRAKLVKRCPKGLTRQIDDTNTDGYLGRTSRCFEPEQKLPVKVLLEFLCTIIVVCQGNKLVNVNYSIIQ